MFTGTTPMKTISDYHAHVYFQPHQQPAAQRLRQSLDTRFDVRLGRWQKLPYGPHPRPMYQVAFTPERLGQILPWLMLNRSGLDILVHPETGDEILDHTDHALWLGQQLPLNMAFFDTGS